MAWAFWFFRGLDEQTLLVGYKWLEIAFVESRRRLAGSQGQVADRNFQRKLPMLL
jgi:hypothetical protein